ncbi:MULTISPECIES: TetR/AcrR family transcriptional regulator [unclassified Nonomuraea]|uniref:TetR/AcrR family transcriptional regulator n=1 Tax=unclassified Nonomuraea TaxID=2593643 RepID=UPI0033C0050F
MASPEENERELILRVATRLFAALGHDGVSIGQIGEAAGLTTAAITPLFPTKRHLYLAVMERAQQLLSAVIYKRAGELKAAAPEERPTALHRFIDGYIDLCVEHPEVPALWMHRWLSDASDIEELESLSAQPLAQYAVDSITALAAPVHADAQFTMYTMVWCIQGFSVSGILDTTGQRRHPDDPDALRRFRAHMHQLLDRLLDLTPSAESPSDS